MALSCEIPRVFRLYVTYVCGEGRFLKITGQPDQQASLLLKSLFQTAEENLEKGIGAVTLDTIHKGVICAAKNKDGTYYRAKVIDKTNIPTGLVRLLFIDFGNEGLLPPSTIRFLDNYDPMFLQLPGQATDFYLSGVIGSSFRWEGDKLMKLQNLLCYSEHPATLDVHTQSIPLISIQYQGNDLTTLLLSFHFGMEIPIEKQESLLQVSDNQHMLKQTKRHSNCLNYTPAFSEHDPFPINHKFPINPGLATPLQQAVSVPLNGSIPATPSLISKSLPTTKTSRFNVNITAPLRQPQHATGPSTRLIPATSTPPSTAPAFVAARPTSKNESITYKSKWLEVNSQHKVFVSFAEEGPELFAVQLATDVKKLQDMMDEINSRCHSSLTEPPMIGTLCLGRKSEDSIICRAIIMNLSGSECKLFFVDFGDIEMVSYYDIFDIPEEFVKPDVFAMRFCLLGVKKLEKGPHLNEVFKQLVNGKALTLTVVAPEGPPLIQYGELHVNHKNILDMLLVYMTEKLQFKWLEMLPMGARHSAIVSYVDSCINFYIQLSDKIDDLNAVMAAVKSHCLNSSSPGALPVGKSCCARFPDDDNWYRACVRNVNGNNIVVSYVDYGNEQEVDVSDLRTITPDLIRMPAVAMKCALKGFENRPLETKSSNQLEMLALEKTLIVHVVGVIFSDTMLVKLLDDSVTPPLEVARMINQLSEPRSSQEMNVTPICNNARESFSFPGDRVPEDDCKLSVNRENCFKNEHQPREENEDFPQRAGRSHAKNKTFIQVERVERKNDDCGSRIGGSGDRDGRSDCRYNRGDSHNNNRGERCDNWREKDHSRDFNTDFGNKDYGNSGKRGGHDSGRGRRDRAARSFDDQKSDKSSRSVSGDRPRSKFTQVQSKEIADPVPLETPFEQATIELGTEHEVSVTWIISPEIFYTQKLSLQPKFLEMMHKIPEIYRGVNSYTGDITVGASVLARYHADGALYRATVVSVQPFSKFVVRYVDFGNKQLVDVRDIWQIDRQLMELPKMAVQCSLNGVAPKDGKWKADTEIDSCFDAPRFQCVFQELADERYKVSLWNNGVSVADTLVEKELAIVSDQQSSVTLNDEPVDLSIIVGQQIPCRVTHVESFESFYIQLDIEKAVLVEQTIANYDLTKVTPLAPELITEGTHCTVKHDGKIYRAVLQDTRNSANIKALLADYGNVITISVENVMVLPTELSVYCYQALKCCFNNYTAESEALVTLDEMKAKLTGNKFIVYVNNVDGIKLLSTLYDAITGQKLAVFTPDDGAPNRVAPLCARAVYTCRFGAASLPHAELLCRLYLQRSADRHRLEQLLDHLYAFYEEGNPEKLTDFEVDAICAVKSTDGNWYRATIVTIEDTQVIVRYTDYGNTESVAKDSVKKLDPEFYEPCSLALVASLGLVALRDDALANLIEWTADKDVQVTLSTGADGWLANLHLDGVDLSMKLIEEKLAALQTAEEVEEQKQETPVDEPIPLPEGCTQMYISHIDTPGRFWLQAADDVDNLEEIQAELQAGADLYADMESRETGALCAAKYREDEQWYRAELLHCDADVTTVRFVDYGNTDALDNRPGLVKVMPESLAAVQRYAIEASVNAVPAGGGEWSEAACERFTQLIGDAAAPVDVLVVKDAPTNVDVFVRGVDLADRLVRDGHAARSVAPECGGLPVCFASHVNSPSEFWIQLESATPELQAMEAAMEDAKTFPTLADPQQGAICAAKYSEDGGWYRARVVVDGCEGTEVLFVDYGNASIASELRILPDELKSQPVLSRKCALKRPCAVKCWSRQSEVRFTELAAEGATAFNVQLIAAGDTSVVELQLDGRSVTEELVRLCEVVDDSNEASCEEFYRIPDEIAGASDDGSLHENGRMKLDEFSVEDVTLIEYMDSTTDPTDVTVITGGRDMVSILAEPLCDEVATETKDETLRKSAEETVSSVCDKEKSTESKVKILNKSVKEPIHGTEDGEKTEELLGSAVDQPKRATESRDIASRDEVVKEHDDDAEDNDECFYDAEDFDSDELNTLLS